ncbi:Asr1405/Asl0597 family protein [Nostoc piscinale]|uniref:Asr1405/Asl0597 family protein n=1 Tax=Nostoc piscinale TaxID=224012 RepID=UPI0009FA416D|nr:Asr1405/Asl0597 family protein [Nostoc piscinale]
MKSFSSGSEIDQKYVVEVNWADRWQVYQRLNELDIPCCCEVNKPLQVEIANPLAMIQFWCVMQRFLACRPELIQTLENSWQSHY